MSELYSQIQIDMRRLAWLDDSQHQVCGFESLFQVQRLETESDTKKFKLLEKVQKLLFFRN